MNPADQNVAAPPPASPPTRVRRWFRWVEHLLAAIGLLFLVYHFCFDYTVMTSESMAPTLKGTSAETGDGILLEKVTARFRSPKRWEIYFFYNSEGTAVAKRVVGLPGEKLAIKGNELLVNGKPVKMPNYMKPVKYYGFGSLAAGREVPCGHGYFMLGDDSKDSYDSRFLGPVTKETFQGRVWLILRPWPRFGWVR